MRKPVVYLFTLFSVLFLSACQTLYKEKALTGQWQVESIYKGGIIDYSSITVQIDDEQRISGSTGCNNITSSIQTQEQQFQVDNIAVTRKLCAPALNAQEQRFITALESAVSYKKVEHQWIYVFDEKNNRILKMVPMQEDNSYKSTSSATPSSAKFDANVTTLTYFQCKQFGRVSVRFLGPDTIELKLNNVAHALSRSATASGAKYSNQDMSFWNKGEKAVFTLDQIDYSCSKSV